MLRIVQRLLFITFCFAAANSTSQSTDIVVGEVKLPSLKWGNQKADIELTNNTDTYKYITVQTVLSFKGEYLNPTSRTISNHVLEPNAIKEIHPEFMVPGNFGQVDLKIQLFDVVDTLDELLDWQKFYEQPFMVRYHVPEELTPYLQERVGFPPRVELHPYFSNEFARILFVLLAEGKSFWDIVSLTKADSAFVKDQIDIFMLSHHMVYSKGSFQPTFPIILLKEAAEEKTLADKIADSLVQLITSNMAGYQPTLDSLAAAKLIVPDSNDFVAGTSVAYRPYPLISVLLLWHDLGNQFITRSAPLLIYDGTDICSASNTQYMYAVQGGENFNGNQFYAFLASPQKYAILYADHKNPPISCDDDFLYKKQHGQPVTWKYDFPSFPEYFTLDTGRMRPVLNALDRGAQPLLVSAYNELKEICQRYGHEQVSYGHRYWLWNLVATRTLQKLTESGVISRRGDGHYRFESVRQK